MKKILMIFAAMAAVLSSCSKSEPESVSANDGKDIVLNISVSNPGADTKALVKSGWAVNDRIKIWFDANTGSTPDLVIKYDGSKWDGTTTNVPTSASGKVKAVYSDKVIFASTDDYTLSGNTLTFSIAHWKFLTEVQVVVYGDGIDATKPEKYTLACDKLTPLAAGNGYTVNADGIAASAGTKGAAVTGISNAGVDLKPGVAFVFATADYSSSSSDMKNFTFTLKDNTSGSEVKTFYEPCIAIEAKENKSSIIALKIENTNFAEILYVEIKMTVGGQKKTYKWAKWNIGAEKETDSGDYFAWGETAPYYEGTGGWPATPTWKSGKGSGYAWQSYCGQETYKEWNPAPYDATTKILKPESDAAAQILGNGWRMPTMEEFEALCSLTKAWKSNYQGSGVNGYMFTDEDGGHSIFLPAAGYGFGTGLSNIGVSGFYWSSSLNIGSLNFAYYLSFNDGSAIKLSFERCLGRSVRALSE